MKRQRIVDSIYSRMNTISVDAGYYTDFNTVDVWRITDYADNNSELPAINIRDMSDSQKTWTISNRNMHMLQIEIEIITQGNLAIKQLRYAIADIEKAIREDETWDGYALKTIPIKNEFVADQSRVKVGGALLTFAVEYITDRYLEY